MAKNSSVDDEFKNIKEDDYKTLISVYQQKTFDLFNQNIALEAKVASMNSIVKKLNETIDEMVKERDKQVKRSSRSKTKTQVVEEVSEPEISPDEETFN